jgi:hypothetical protein
VARRRHHVVSRGYQRFFADGERVLLIDKNTRTYKEVGTRDTFVEAHFNSWRTQAGWDDSLEDQWQRIEGLVLPDVRVLLAGAGGEQQRESAKILAAVAHGPPDTITTAAEGIVPLLFGRSAFLRTEPEVSASLGHAL